MLYCSWDEAHEDVIIIFQFGLFFAFSPNYGDTIILHKCTKNHDMLYCSWGRSFPLLTEELACPSTTNVHAVSGHFAQNVPPTSRTQLGNPVNYNQMMYSSWYGAQQMDGQKKWYRGGWVPHVKSEHFSFI